MQSMWDSTFLYTLATALYQVPNVCMYVCTVVFITFEAYNITLLVGNYKTNQLQNFTFFIMELKSEIILGHLASNRLGLTKVLCHNKVKKQFRAVGRSCNTTSMADQLGPTTRPSPPEEHP